jgi:hypothetical protein
MIYTGPYVMHLMQANQLQRKVGRGWALEVDTFLGPVKWHRAVQGHINQRSVGSFMYRRPTLYPLEIAVDFLKSP